MKVLLDTCVLAELCHAKGQASVRSAVTALPHEALFISVITLGEIVKGVELLAEGRKKQELRQWLQEINQDFADHILIAATALRHGLHVMTRNTKHFAATGVLVLDPWKTA